MDFTAYHTARAHAAKTLSNGNSYTYDNNGNQVTRLIGGQTYNLTYNAENQLVSVTGPSSFSATFTYDGDGRRVKAVENGVTTLFIGGHYEVKGSEITKYYFAGASRIAMRKYTIPQNMTLTYLLGDHLGSTSLTVDASTGETIETRYKPWGEVRFTTADKSLPTRYTFTGQFSHVSDEATDLGSAGFGLMFYNARWVDVQLGRFVQADSIVPAGVQGLDRYAYVRNSPVRYIDPSGHTPVCVLGGTSGSCLIWSGLTGSNGAHGFENFTNDIDANLDRYGVKLIDGNKTWSMTDKSAALKAVALVAGRMESTKNRSGVDLFRESFSSSSENPIIMVMGTSAAGIYLGDGENPKSCANITSGGCTTNSHTINFASLFPNGYFMSKVNNIIHELGHAFNAGHGSSPMDVMPEKYVSDRADIFLPNGITVTYQMNTEQTPSETFADLFLAWTIGAYRATDLAGEASLWINGSMSAWLP